MLYHITIEGVDNLVIKCEDEMLDTTANTSFAQTNWSSMFCLFYYDYWYIKKLHYNRIEKVMIYLNVLSAIKEEYEKISLNISEHTNLKITKLLSSENKKSYRNYQKIN